VGPYTPLRIAVEQCHTECVELLLDYGVLTTFPIPEYRALLILLAENYGDQKMVDLLKAA